MDEITESILKELAQAENVLLATDDALRVAELKRAIALTGFATLQSMAKLRLERSPYSLSKAEWPHLENPKAGRFRYARMTIGDAAIDALQQFGTMRSEQLTEKLQEGGAPIKSEREVHAAVINKKGLTFDKETKKVSLTEEGIS